MHCIWVHSIGVVQYNWNVLYSVKPRGVVMGLLGDITYKDNVDFAGKVALKERIILFICGLACSTCRVIKYIM